jgi:CRISPR type III-B/RAMP module RAMP protein Cmr6
MIITATNDVRTALGGDSFPKLESPSLRLEKFVRLEHANKKEEIDAVVACHNRSRHLEGTPCTAFPGAVNLPMKLRGRLIVNQAGGVLENAGMCLHRHFGVPTIPGSAVKGVARHAAWCEWRQAMDDGQHQNAMDLARKIACTFGFPTGDPKTLDQFIRINLPDLQDQAGSVAFLPASPVGKAKLVVDIVTCHHMDYYAGKTARALDNEQPNPQFFPAVEEGCEFNFTLLPIKRTLVANGDFYPLDFARKSLLTGLDLYGIGAKTASGYGWLTVDEVATTNFEAQKQAEEKERQRHRDEEERRLALAAMSPLDRKIAELAELDDAQLKNMINTLETADELLQKAVIKVLLGAKTHIWASDKKDKPKKKGGKRAVIIRKVAMLHGIDLP